MKTEHSQSDGWSSDEEEDGDDDDNASQPSLPETVPNTGKLNYIIFIYHIFHHLSNVILQ